MPEELSQEWLNWIFENLRIGRDKDELLETLLKEGFNPIQCKIALGLELGKDDLEKDQAGLNQDYSYSQNPNISKDRMMDVDAEIYTIKDFLSHKECSLLIEKIKNKLRPSTIASSGVYDKTYRTSSTCDLGNIQDSFLKAIDEKICNFIGIDPSYGETLQGQHYLETQEFKEHTDYFEGSQLIDHDKGMGQRTYTFMIYLNEVKEGGETEFKKLNQSFAPMKGKALIWNNLDDNGRTNANTIHQAHPIIRGEKTIITKWFREKNNKKFNLKSIPTYTTKGFKKTRLETDLYSNLLNFYREHKDEFIDEFVAGDFIKSELKGSPSTLFDLSTELRSSIHESLQEPLENWSQIQLEPTFVYGIREYKEGAILVPHRDRDETHIVSAIINIDKEVNEDWPLVIEDHNQKKHEVFLDPGEVLFYESAKLLHGRPYPLKGKSYANIFCHYKPLNLKSQT